MADLAILVIPVMAITVWLAIYMIWGGILRVFRDFMSEMDGDL